MGLGGVISYVLSLGAKLLPAVNESSQQASSSSSPLVQQHQIETEMEKLMELRERIKATLSAADQREIKDNSVKLWLKELKRLAYDADDVLDEYHFEVLRTQVEASDDFLPKPHERKLIQVPGNMLEQIQKIKSKFVEIEKDRIALQLLEEDGPRYSNSDQQIAPTSHFALESDIIGREKEKDELINLLFSKCPDCKIVSVVAIVGTGGIGKTTLAQLVYNDQKIRQNFDKFGWVCVSENFNVQRLTREVVESITGKPYGLATLSALQENLSKEIRRERIFLVLDDVWNEKRNHWEIFQAPFMVASLVKILVTTRNKPVARIMQTVPTFDLSYMSKEQSWKLFQHYAFGEVNQNRGSNLVGIGKKIMKKCGMLPLAIKSIGSLLRHETDEESWKDILESQLWESDAGSEIFSSLQISYARLPTYLKPCFLYCSMFPRNYRYSVEKLVQLWIYQGYVRTNGLKNVEKIGQEYAKQLWQRSFFEGEYGEREFQFSLHDMIHDLARYNSGHGCYSIEGNMVPNFPEDLYHLYVDHRVKLIKAPPSTKFATLRTLIVEDHCDEVFLGSLDFSKASKLRALQFGSRKCDLESYFSLVDLKHLRYLSISWGCFKRLPEYICSLYNLQNLTLYYCYHLIDLPKNIGNLISLEELRIFGSANLRMLPMSICQLKVLRKLDLCGCTKLVKLPPDMGNLTNLELLRIRYNNVSSLPPSLNKIIRIQALNVKLDCSTIGWLEYFVDLDGTLILIGLSRLRSLNDAHRANLVSMHNLRRLILSWNHWVSETKDGSALELNIFGDGREIDSNEENYEMYNQPHSLMVRLQPHPNLKELKIVEYPCLRFSTWIGNPTLCASLESVELVDCKLITFLPFGCLFKLKNLQIYRCSSLQFIQKESLPLALEEVTICYCRRLISVRGTQRLKFLVRLDIIYCRELQVLDDSQGWGTCIITVSRCPKLKEWCTRHEIHSKGTKWDEYNWSEPSDSDDDQFWSKINNRFGTFFYLDRDNDNIADNNVSDNLI